LAVVVTALHLLALALFDPAGAPATVSGRPIDLGAYLLAVLSAAPLVFRRSRPWTVLVLTTTGLLMFAFIGYIGPFVGYGMVAALYSVVVYRGTRAGLIGAAGAYAAVLVAYAVAPWDVDAASIGFDLLVVATAVALGDGTRNRMAATREQEARLAELAEQQARGARQAVLDERTRIARELHDLVAHSMSIVAVQAGVGHHLIERDPAKAKEALATIETTSRQALTEMRRLLGVLRTDHEEPGAELTPQPGLNDVEPLLRHAREAGLHVEMHVEGPPRSLPSGVALSAYRILQEALTNAVKHAGPANVDVRLRWGDDALRIEVDDDGRGSSTYSEGHHGFGLVGMRERATVAGGDVHAGARPGGGFRVVARLPYHEAG
jgi:signal transduction histidine kinase